MLMEDGLGPPAKGANLLILKEAQAAQSVVCWACCSA